jgi:hypothetical protein
LIGKSQNLPSIRWEPTFSATKKIDSRWSYNFTVRARQKLTNYGDGDRNFKTDRWDIISAGTYSLFNGKKLGLGYLYRTYDPFEPDGGQEHRITQQFAFITTLGGYRIGNKFLIEERIRSFDYMTRLRYGISLDFPLQGKKLDPREIYIITGNELVYAFNRFMNQLENRFTLGVGWLLQNDQKLQLTAESRFNDLISDSRNHILQIKTIYYFSF